MRLQFLDEGELPLPARPVLIDDLRRAGLCVDGYLEVLVVRMHRRCQDIREAADRDLLDLAVLELGQQRHSADAITVKGGAAAVTGGLAVDPDCLRVAGPHGRGNGATGGNEAPAAPNVDFGFGFECRDLLCRHTGPLKFQVEVLQSLGSKNHAVPLLLDEVVDAVKGGGRHGNVTLGVEDDECGHVFCSSEDHTKMSTDSSLSTFLPR